MANGTSSRRLVRQVYTWTKSVCTDRVSRRRSQDKSCDTFQQSAKANAERGSLTLKQACSGENLRSAMCVQNLDDSRDIAIRITYRISLRSSSLWEPRHPSLKVVRYFVYEAVLLLPYGHNCNQPFWFSYFGQDR